MPFKPGIRNGSHDGRIVQLLIRSNFMTPWNTSGVVVAKILVIGADLFDNVSFLDLHVINVVEEFKMV